MRVFKLVTLPVCLLCSLAGCSYQYIADAYEHSMSNTGLSDLHHYSRQSDWVFPSDVHIALIPIDLAKETTAPRTATHLNDLLKHAFAYQFPHTTLLEPENTLHVSIQSAFSSGSSIVISTKLLEVENNLNTWNELHETENQHLDQKYGRDVISVQFLVYETLTGKLLDRITLKSKAAYFKRDDALPMRMLETALRRVVDDIAGVPPSA